MKSPQEEKLQRLQCSVQNYDWGLLGRDSQVARLFALNSGSRFEPEKPYAELWMGTHDSGPSFLVDNRENGVVDGSEFVTLKSWLSRNPNVLGDKVLKKWGCDLPFLFKVWFSIFCVSEQNFERRLVKGTLGTVFFIFLINNYSLGILGLSLAYFLQDDLKGAFVLDASRI